MYKNDPLKVRFVFFLIFFAPELLLLSWLTFRSGGVDLFDDVLLLFVLVMVIVTIVVYIRLLQRTKLWRSWALQGDQTLLAQAQPLPDARALPLPTTIMPQLSAKEQRRFVGMFLLMVIISMFAGVAIASLNAHRSLFAPKPLLILGIVMLVLVILALLALWLGKLVWVHVLKQKITVQEQGITVRYFGQSTTILWNEARNFTLWSRKWSQGAVSYELVGKDRLVHWDVHAKARPGAEDYLARLQALPSLIVAKTQLPLYDLREENVKMVKKTL